MGLDCRQKINGPNFLGLTAHGNYEKESPLILGPTNLDKQKLLYQQGNPVSSSNKNSLENQIHSNNEMSKTMSTGESSLGKSTEISIGGSQPCLPTSIVEVKKLARAQKKLGEKFSSSFEEKRWRVKKREEEVSEEARQAWEVGKRLGLLSKISDEDMRRQIEILEKEDRVKARKAKKSTVSGAKENE